MSGRHAEFCANKYYNQPLTGLSALQVAGSNRERVDYLRNPALAAELKKVQF